MSVLCAICRDCEYNIKIQQMTLKQQMTFKQQTRLIYSTFLFTKYKQAFTHSLTGPHSSRAVAPAFHTTRSLARLQDVATGTPVLDLIWLIHEERGRPLGRFQDVGIRRFMDVSLHNLWAMLHGTSAGRRTT